MKMKLSLGKKLYFQRRVNEKFNKNLNIHCDLEMTKAQLDVAKGLIKKLLNVIDYLKEDEIYQEDFFEIHEAQIFIKEITE